MIDEDALAMAYNRGLDHEAAGDLEAAAEAYAEVLRLDPADHGGVAVRLAALGLQPSPDKAPDAYVATLFDQNAAQFDDMLVEQLGYAVPMLLRERLEAVAPGPYPRLLDLGCGTGLTGVSLAGWCDDVTGVDLSERMLDEAHERDVYDHLYVGEAVDFLSEIEEAPWDLIAATDVLPYIGDLEPFFSALRGRLVPGGVLAVSTETEPDMTDAFKVGAKRRFAHGKSYLEQQLDSAGLVVRDWKDIVVRYDEGAPVPGFLILAQSPAPDV